MPALDEKKTYFDRYWQRQPIEISDPRALERARAIHRLLEGKRGKLLDLGCGRGLALDFFAERGYEVTGADISPDAIQSAHKKGHNAYILDLEKDDLPGQYDLILCLEVLQQVFAPVPVLKKLNAALMKEGCLVVSLPNEFHIVSRCRLLMGRSHLGHFDHSHIRLFSPKRNEELLSRAGMVVLEKKHIGIAPPRYGFIATLINFLAQAMPSLLAISSIYVLRKS